MAASASRRRSGRRFIGKTFGGIVTMTPTATAALPGHALLRRCRAGLLGAALALLGLSALAAPAAAEGLKIELNKLEDNAGSCLASLLVQNRLGHTLDRFSLDLYVFDNDGVIARQVLLDMAPLRDNQMTVARFALIKRPCADVGRILVNNVPSCRSEGTGEDLDCLADLAVSSRSKVDLVK